MSDQSKQGDTIGVREAARQLGVHENTIRNWQKRGLLKAAQLPSGIRRFSREEVERMRAEMWSQFAPATVLPEPRACRRA
jgi:excisionase family DNA binding protein